MTHLPLAFVLLAQSVAPHPDVEWARVRQVVLPELSARQVNADTRERAARDYFAGRVSLEAAFPHFADAPVGSDAWIAGRLAQLDVDGVERAVERTQTPPNLGSPSRVRTLRGATAAALDAEQLADDAERRLLHGLRALLQRAPLLHEDAVTLLLGPVNARVAAAEERFLNTPDDPKAAKTAAAKQVADASAARQEMLALIRLLRTHATVRNAPAIDPSAELAAIDARAAARLRLMRPFVDPPLAQRIDNALAAWVTGPGLAAASTARPVDPAWDGAERQRQHAIASAEILALDARLSTLANGTPEYVLAVAQRRTAQEFIGKLRATTAAPALATPRDTSQALKAAQADLTKARASGDTGRIQLAEIELDTATLRDTYQKDEQSVSKRQRELDDTLATLRSDVGTRSVDEVFLDGRSLLNDLVGEQEEAENQVRKYEERLQITELAIPGARVPVKRVLEPKIAVLKSLVALHRGHAERMLDTLVTVEEFRDELRPLTSRDARAEDRALLFSDIRRELGSAMGRLWRNELTTLNSLQSLPAKIRRNPWVYLRPLFIVLAGLIGWIWLRRRMPMLISEGVDRLALRRNGLYRREVRRLEGPLTPFAIACLDLGVALALLFGYFRTNFPELGLVLLVYCQVVGYRAMTGLFYLSVSPREEPRPALASMKSEAYALADQTVKLAVLWIILRQFIGFVLANLLQMRTAHGVVTTAFWVLGGVLVLWLLHRWQPHLQETVKAQGTTGRFMSLLVGRPHRNLFTSWFWALTDLSVLIFFGAQKLLRGRVEEDSVLARVLSVLDRRRMAQTPMDAVPVLPRKLSDVILAEDCPGECYVPRPEADAQLQEVIESWDAVKRRGVIGVVGDRGDGKRTWLNHVTANLREGGYRIVRAGMSERIETVDDLVAWLSSSLQLGTQKSLDDVSAALGEAEQSIFLIEETQLAFLRAVGGFDALRALLRIVSTHDDKHCWILSMHRPAWAYLSRVGDALGADIFRAVIELAPMGEDQLRELVVQRTQATGHEAEFHSLVRRHPLGGGNYAADMEQAKLAFFRLLADASNGNPAVALRLWAESVVIHDHDEGSCEVRLTDAISQGAIENIDETELFSLAALRIQDTLDAAELARVNNMPDSQVQVSLEVLFGRDLIWREGKRVGINLRYLPAVTRTLRRRQFLHWRS